MQAFEQFVGIVDNKVLKLVAQPGVPFRQVFQGLDGITIRKDLKLMRLDVLKIETRISMWTSQFDAAHDKPRETPYVSPKATSAIPILFHAQ